MKNSELQNQSTTWLCLDGPILPNWCDNFNALLDSDLYMELKNGDHLKNTCKIVFETTNIENSAPSLLSKAVRKNSQSFFFILFNQTRPFIFCEKLKGIIYFGDEIVGWRSIARSWLESRTQNQILVKIY